tara:strand:+ start:2219 stop:3733 length:1515 start_codon:yes stop_codon:yes gene_type:complete
MDAHYIDFSKTNMFSKKFNEFIDNHKEKPYFPTYDNIERIANNFNLSIDSRKKLSDEITSQYGDIEIPDSVSKNIISIKKENTFTVTTGHQLNIFSGPLYTIYKIISTIKLAENLRVKYKDKNFVPVYWMASEDHDFDEIKTFFSKGKTYEWDINPSGAVGGIDPSSIKKLSGTIPESIEIFEDAYLTSNTLSEAVRKYMNALFSTYGLIVFDPDSKALKASIKELIRSDIFDNTISKVEDSSDEKSDVYVRKINFFYMKEGLRERIESVNDKFVVRESQISFSKQEMEKEINSNPQRFSPNVVMRCLYQQMIMPNVAYIGGPAEVVYWLSFRKFFEKYDGEFPVIVPRDSVLIISSKSSKTLDKYGLDIQDIFNGKNNIEKKSLGVLVDEDKNFSSEIKKIREQFNLIASKYKSVDKTMSPHVLANSKKTEKMLIQVEKRFIKSQKDLNKILVDRVGDLFHECFPEGTPQERKDNIMSFFNSTFIEDLVRILDPMELKFKIIT